MKKIIPVLVLLLISTMVLFAGCATKIATPASNDEVVGNGGLSVTKGDYVYYVNGYESYENLKDTNKNKQGSVEISAIYCAKLVNGELTDKVQLVSKVGGFEYSDLYIFGDKLYFLSPNTKADETGSIRNDIVTLCSIGLNGKKYSEIYTPTQYSSGDFTMKEVNGNVYALMFDGTNLIKIDINNKNKVTTISENVTSVGWAKDQTCYSKEAKKALDSSLDKYVFYTRSRNEQEGSKEGVGGNILAKYDLSTSCSETVSSNINTTILIDSVVGGRLFYKKGDYYYSSDLKSSNELQHTYIAVDSFTPLGKDEQGNELGIAITYNSRLYIQKLTDIVPSNEILNDSITVICSNIDTILYKDDASNIKTISIKDKTITTVYENDGLTLLSYIDYDGRNIFFFASVENYGASYTYYVDSYKAVGGQTDATLIANLIDSDKTSSEE